MLLERGVPAKQICIVSPDHKPGKSCFNNREVDLKVIYFVIKYLASFDN